jgi:hypothetical protein
MSHTDKYLKYKNKYLELKKQVGGGDTDSLNIPDDLLHSFFKAMLLFLNTISKKTVKYFHLLEIAGIKQTYFTQNFLTDINNVAQNIADYYKLRIFLPKYVDTIFSKMAIGSKTVEKKENWKKITGANPMYDVVILKDKDKYKLVNDQKIPYNDSIHSFFKAILLFLNNYLEHNTTYFVLLQSIGNPNMFIKNKDIDTKIKEYAKIIEDKFSIKILFSSIKNIGSKNDVIMIQFKNPARYNVLILKNEDAKYNLVVQK